MYAPLSFWLLLSPAALAEDAARRAERAGDPAAEQAACLQIVADSAPSAARVRCERRLVWLAHHQDPDGTFRSLQALEVFRQTARVLSPEAARVQAVAIAQDPDAAPQVRQEAALWLAREALRREDAADALAWTTPLWTATAVTPAPSTEIADLHARALLLSGQADAARAVEDAARPVRSARAREGYPLLRLEQRRGRLHRLAWSCLGAYLLPAFPLAIVGWRQAPRPLPRPQGLLALLLIGAASAALAILREPDSRSAFLVLVGGLALLHLLSAGALLVPLHPRLRAALRLGAALASAAVGYLVLQDSGQLEALGL